MERQTGQTDRQDRQTGQTDRTDRQRHIFSKTLLLSSDITSEGSIAIVKKFDFDFSMIFYSTSLPQNKNVF